MEAFEKQWKKQLNDVSHILRYLNTYPGVIKHLEISQLIKPEELITNQIEWIKLCNSYTGMEKDFFQKYWVPIDKLDFTYFIDLYNPKYPLFDFHFSSIEPHEYMRENLFDSIGELMLSEDNEVNFEHLKDMQGFKYWGLKE